MPDIPPPGWFSGIMPGVPPCWLPGIIPDIPPPGWLPGIMPGIPPCCARAGKVKVINTTLAIVDAKRVMFCFLLEPVGTLILEPGLFTRMLKDVRSSLCLTAQHASEFHGHSGNSPWLRRPGVRHDGRLGGRAPRSDKPDAPFPVAGLRVTSATGENRAGRPPRETARSFPRSGR